MLSKVLRKLAFSKSTRISAGVTELRVQNSSSSAGQNVMQSKLRQVEIPNLLLEDFMWNGLDKYADRTIVECAETGRSYTYTDIYKKSKALANFLHKIKELRQGDTVAIILPNVPEYPIILLDEIARQLANSEAKMVFTLRELWSSADQAIQSSLKTKIPVVLIEHRDHQATPLGAIKFKETIEGNHNLSFKITRSVNDVIIVPYSSGTTGLPKGVELTNKNIVSNLTQLDVEEFSDIFDDSGSQDVVPLLIPMFHIYGMVPVLLAMMSQGCKLITVPKFEPQAFIDILENYKPTLGVFVPTLILFLINHPLIRQDHLARLRAIMSGAAPLGATDIERLREKAKKEINVRQGYGLTETSSMVLCQTFLREDGIKIGGSGFLVPNTECKVVSLENRSIILGPRQPGELIIRGPQVMKGYLNNKKATDEVLDSDRWFTTGDIGYYDEDKHFFVTNRLKELIKVKGFQVAPAELEEILRDHPDVADAAVAGVPHAEYGEAPKAFIVLKKGATFNPTNIQEYVASKVAKYKHLIGGVVATDSIPKTPSGKIVRHELKEI